MIEDIGYLIFVQILKMTEYPGGPFTGRIIDDLIMFLFIPTVFIIVIIYTLVGRLTYDRATGQFNRKIGLLLSIAFYLFIIVGGYYRMFALLAGPYFLFLLIIVGIFYFFVGHFGLRRGGGFPAAAAQGAVAEEALHKLPKRLQGLIVAPALNPRERAELERYREGLSKQITRLQKDYNHLVETGNTRDLPQLSMKINELETERDMIEKALRGGY